MDHKEDKDQVIDLQEHMDKSILKLATLKKSTSLNIQRLREYYSEALNSAKNNGTTETIENNLQVASNVWKTRNVMLWKLARS